MHYAKINDFDIANGPGIRANLFVSGCRNKCPGCFNLEAQDFTFGEIFNQSHINHLIDVLNDGNHQGLTVLGGEPLEPENQQILSKLLQQVRLHCPNTDIWVYTGFTYEQLQDHSTRADTPYLPWILENTDVLVDGPFIEAQKNVTLQFRGSENQRLINLKEMRKNHDLSHIILWNNGLERGKI